MTNINIHTCFWSDSTEGPLIVKHTIKGNSRCKVNTTIRLTQSKNEMPLINSWPRNQCNQIVRLVYFVYVYV